MRRFVATLGSAVVVAGLAGACASSTDRGTVPLPSGPSDATPAVPGPEACDSTQAGWAVGERATEALLEKARKAAGARTARFLRPGQAITMEYLASRLNLELDKQDVVQSVRCG